MDSAVHRGAAVVRCDQVVDMRVPRLAGPVQAADGLLVLGQAVAEAVEPRHAGTGQIDPDPARLNLRDQHLRLSRLPRLKLTTVAAQLADCEAQALRGGADVGKVAREPAENHDRLGRRQVL